LLKEIKKLAIDLDRTVNDLLEEGIEYLLKKYKKKAQK
jgi:5'(3')-deoxyribonucleotidase